MTALVPPLTGLFVTGTDTNVGKTFFACALLRAAVAQRRPLLPYKPAESGTRPNAPSDATALQDAADAEHVPLTLICPHRFAPPVAPAAAAHAAGQRLTPAALVRTAHALSRFAPAWQNAAAPPPAPSASASAPPSASAPASAPTPLLVEGAGGLLSPYAPRFTPADLAAALGLPLLIVARNDLGTINHTALAVAECRRRHLTVIGIVLITTAPVPNLAAQRNGALIEAQTGLRPFLVPHFTGTSRTRLARAAAHLQTTGIAARVFAAAGISRVATPALRSRRARRRPSSGK